MNQINKHTPPLFVVIDMQVKLAPAMKEYSAVLMQTQRLTKVATLLGVEHIITEQNPQGLGSTDKSLLAVDAQLISKDTFSAAQSAEFTQSIGTGVNRDIYICGMESHVCVYHTANELQRQGHTVTVIADAVCSRDPEHKLLALQQLRANGVQVCASETVLFSWLNSCRHPHFKEVLALIK